MHIHDRVAEKASVPVCLVVRAAVGLVQHGTARSGFTDVAAVILPAENDTALGRASHGMDTGLSGTTKITTAIGFVAGQESLSPALPEDKSGNDAPRARRRWAQ